MDPNETLNIIRGLVREALADEWGDDRENELATAVNDLDEWLGHGGSLPLAWKGAHFADGHEG